MTNLDIATLRAHKALARQDYERQTTGPATGDYGSAGPPSWNRAAWDSFKAQYGFYPFGRQTDGSLVAPPTYAGAPDWVYELMGLRKPPITVHSGETFWTP